jgi:hypothetical protein
LDGVRAASRRLCGRCLGITCAAGDLPSDHRDHTDDDFHYPTPTVHRDHDRGTDHDDHDDGCSGS